jgi:hypothetical protein
VANLVAVVRAKVEVLSGVVPRVVVQAQVAKVAKAKTAIRARKSTTDSLLL